MPKKILPITLVFIFLCPFISIADKPSNFPTPGLIINAPNLLLDMQEYQGSPSGQGGIGIKLDDLTINQFKFNLRGIFGLHLMDGFDQYRLDAGLAAEFPFFKKTQISPYWGFFATLGFLYLKTDTPPGDYWAKDINIPISFGPLLGVEVFLTEYFSFFAEYCIAADFNYTQTSTSTTAPVDNTNFTLNTALGNGAMLGFVIYFKKVVELNKD